MFFFSSRRRHTRCGRDWSSDVCSSDLLCSSAPSRTLEIISYVLEGALEHKDSIGTGSVIRPGDVQVMSAGTGIRHSEFNHSKTEPVHFLQIWVVPDHEGIAPRYEQKTVSDADKRSRLRLVSS